jgi:hypothetical protein
MPFNIAHQSRQHYTYAYTLTRSNVTAFYEVCIFHIYERRIVRKLCISQLLPDILRGTTVEPPDKRPVFVVQTDPHRKRWLVLKARVST